MVEGKRGPKILLLDIDGEITESEGRGPLGIASSESTVARVRSQLQRAAEDDAVRAVVLRIQSAGGTVTASDIVYEELLRFRAKKKIPVVAQLMGIATSGAYYVAMAADAVYAHPTTLTGSVGVVFVSVNVAGLFDKLGIENQTLTAGVHKDAGSPLRRLRPEERAQLQSVLDDLHARFRDVVARGRPQLGAERLQQIADGRVVSAGEAKALGLVDGIGYLTDAVDEAERRAGIEDSRLVSYHRPREQRENFYSRSFAPAVQVDFGSLLGTPRGPGFFYLWAPAAR